MDSKKIIAKLIKIASNQQKIIQKLAQELQVQPAVPSGQVALTPNKPNYQDQGTVIMNNLPPNIKAAIAKLTSQADQVLVTFHPGKGTDEVFNTLVQIVSNLQNTGKLRPIAGPYHVKEVA